MMAKVYQPKKGNQYYLDHDIYMQSIWFIWGYDRRRQEADAIIEESSPPSDGMPRSTFISEPLAAKVLRQDKLLARNRIIDNALLTVPPDYRESFLKNILHSTPYPYDKCGIPLHARSIYQRYKARIIYDVAMGLELI